MTGTFDGNGELTLLLGREAGFGNWLDATIYIDVAL